MHVFLIAASRTGDPIDPDFSVRLDQPTLAELHFEPDEHMLWRNASQSVVVAGWQAFAENNGVGSHWHLDKGGLTAFAGHLWPHGEGWKPTGDSWAAQLHCYYQAHEPQNSRELLFGKFSAMRFPAQGEGWLGTDILGMGVIYVAETDKLRLFSNRSSVAARFATGESTAPQRDAIGTLWMAYWKHGSPFDTGFSSVKPLPQNHFVRFPAKGDPIILRYGSSLVSNNNQEPPEIPFERIVDMVDDDLQKSLSAVARLPTNSNREFRLSGGMDSRLLLSAILKHQLTGSYAFHSYGVNGNRDVRVAHQLASQFQLPWSLEHRGRASVEDSVPRLMSHVFQSDGMVNASDLGGTTDVSDQIIVSGTLGEFLRVNRRYAIGVKHQSVEAVLDQFLQSAFRDRGGFLTNDFKQEANVRVRDWAAQFPHDVASLPRTIAAGRMHLLARTWIGISRTTKANLWISPFTTPVCVRAVHHLPSDGFVTERIHFEIMRRHNESLLFVPFAEKSWNQEALASYDRAKELARIDALPSVGTAYLSERKRRFAAWRPMFKEVVQDSSQSLQNYVNIEKVMQSIDRPPSNPKAFRELIGLLTANIWLSGREQPTRIQRS